MADERDWNQQIIDEFRANGGEVSSPFGKAPMLLLHTTGVRTGLTRVTPMMYQQVGNTFAVFASNGGAPTHPGWYHNLQGNPAAEIEVGSETIDVRARVAVGEERSKIWETQKQRYPIFAEHEQAAAAREIPVVILSRTS
jgi:deazaflavin-dependent oxidoreductase (nitroreductase family)